MMQKTTKQILCEFTHELENDKFIELRVYVGNDGFWWEVSSDVWDEIQPPDGTLEACLHDLVENMKVYRNLGVTYADILLVASIGFAEKHGLYRHN